MTARERMDRLLEAAEGLIYHVEEGCPTWELDSRLDRLRTAIASAKAPFPEGGPHDD